MTLVELPDGTWLDPDAVIALQPATFDGGTSIRLDVPGEPLVVACSPFDVVEALRAAHEVQRASLGGPVLDAVPLR